MSYFDAPVRRYMTSSVITIPAGAPLIEAEQLLEESGISCLVVTGRDGKLAGVLSRTDLLRVGRRRARMAEDPHLLTLPRQFVHQQMVADVATVASATPVRVAATILAERHIHRVFVVEDGMAVGVLSTQDLLRVVIDERLATPIAAWMSSPVLGVEVSDSVALATDRLGEAGVRGLVVLEAGWPVGIFTQIEALAAHRLEPETPVEEAMSCAMLCLPVTTPLFRAASFALATRSRRILAVEARELRGVLSGLDMARVAMARGVPKT